MIKFNLKNINKTKGKSILKRTCLGIMAAGLLFTCTGCNKTLIDAKRGFDKAIITGNDSAIVLDIKEWGDYPGEQLQLKTEDDLVILTSSFDTDQYFNMNISDILTIANNKTSDKDNVYTIALDNNDYVFYNKKIWDLHYKFNKAFISNNNHGLLLPVAEWNDYQGEQLQVITNDGLVIVVNSYNTKLIDDSNSKTKAIDFAKMYLGTNGIVTDYAQNYNSNIFNKTILDLRYSFNKAIIIKDERAIIVPINNWIDYEGEQIQISIVNGPVVLTAAYDTFLINDTVSNIKAIDVANSLSNNVIDLTNGKEYNSLFNKNLLDLTNGFSNGILSNNNSATSIKINSWKDYEGEQLQIEFPNKDSMLTSSFLLDLISGGTNDINATTLAKNYVYNGMNLDYSNNNIDNPFINKQIFDLTYSFDYALKINNGNVTIIPINSWKDFENNDGETWTDAQGNTHKLPDSPNCEQLQLILPDGTVLLTTAYNTVLLKTNNPEYYANMFVSNNGIITDLTNILGKPKHSLFNFQFIDLNYKFTKAIELHNDTAQIYNVSAWYDYADGEQVQIWTDINSGILTSYFNTTLLTPKTNGLEEILAKAFTGTLNKEEVKTYVFKK